MEYWRKFSEEETISNDHKTQDVTLGDGYLKVNKVQLL